MSTTKIYVFNVLNLTQFACLFSVNRVMIILLLEKLILAETAFIRIVMQLDAEIKQS